jgi:hypothetical protein
MHFKSVMKLGHGNKKVPKRQYRMVASEQTDVIFVSIAKFYYFFTDSELKKMQNHVVEIDRADI